MMSSKIFTAAELQYLKLPRKHTTRTSYLSAAEEMWPQAEWITGRGRWATLAHCNDALTICLWTTKKEAHARLQEINVKGCGGCCIKDHSLVDMEDVI